MPDESTGFEPEPFTLAALAGQEHLRERLYAAQNALVKRDAEIARLADERAGLARDALLSLAAEFDDLAALSGTLAPTYLLGMADAARMARERAERAPGTANSTAPVSQDHGERTDDYSAAEPTWTATRSQLIDALANIEVRGVQTSGPMAGKVIADDMADAILAQLPGGAP